MDHSLKMVKVASYVLLVASCLTPAHGGTNCFQCSDIPSARDCDTVVECNPYEVCYSTQVVASSGHIYRRMGCRDKRQCTSGIVGKRSLVRAAGDLPVCDGCCNSTLCQPKLCQDLDFDAKRGPICFNCNDQLPEEKCTRIRECGRDEVCYMSYKRSPSRQILRQTGCYSKQICDRLSASLAGHATNETCWKCCSGDLCNAGCGLQSHTSAPGVFTTRTPATSLVKLASYFLLVTSCLTSAHGGTKCFQCSDIPGARDCDTVVECESFEVCYSTQIVSATGHIFRRIGCRDNLQCTSGLVGKRSLVRNAGDLPICEGCCNSTLCQPKLCQDQDFSADRGPVCYNCENQAVGEKCTKIRECGRGQVCYMSLKKSPSGHMLRRSGCFDKRICDGLAANPAFHATNGTCWKCCSDDLCNSGCGVQSHTGVITTRTPATSSNCVDKTLHATCQLASSVVCQDTAHAQNAGCMHSCGFC